MGTKEDRQTSISTKSDGPLHEMHFHRHDHQVSWRRHGEGYATLHLTTHERNPWLSFEVAEVAQPTIKPGKYVEKRVFLSLDANEARQMYEWLKERFDAAEKSEAA